MPKAIKKSVREQSPPSSDDHNSTDSAEASDSDHNQDLDVSFHPVVPPNQVPTMFMPYIEGPKMNWTVDDGFYHRFLKWSGNFGMDLYISWNIPKDDLMLDVIWNKFEEFSKPQTNEVWARFDLLTHFCQGSRNVDKWYNAVQAQVNLAKYPPEMVKILHHDIFWFFMRDEDFVTKRSTRAMLIFRNFQLVKCAN